MALSLVSGQPFDQLRAVGYEWLTDGARIDHYLVCGIADVAHLVTTHGLAAGDIKRARAAAEIAQLAAPYEEIPRAGPRRGPGGRGAPAGSRRLPARPGLQPLGRRRRTRGPV